MPEWFPFIGHRVASPENQAERGSFVSGSETRNEHAPRSDGNPVHSKRIAMVRTEAGDLVPATDKLLAFRSLTGIYNVPTLSTPGNSERVAPNVGIYPRVVQAEKAAAFRYRLFQIANNFCLGAQIIVGAALTAIGAANGSHTAVIVFGALNTVMAAILTYLKASGLPGGLKTRETMWKEIREYIEQRERELYLADCSLDVRVVVADVEEMYDRAKAELDQGGGGTQQPHRAQSFKALINNAATKVAHATAENKSEQTKPPVESSTYEKMESQAEPSENLNIKSEA